MRKVSILLTTLLFCATSLFAQKLSFQAVVRNSANELVPNTTLTVAVSVLDATNNVQYSENHTGVQTNQNGLLSLMVGDGTPTSTTTMADVVWNGASIQTVITLPGGATITNTTPVNAVPYALSAGNVDPTVLADAIADYLAHHSIGGEDNVQADWDETDPTSDAYVQHKPTDVSEFNNDANYVTTTQLNAANYITAADIPAQVNADWNATSGAAQILNKPTIPTVPANVSEFNNDANYVNNSTCDTIDFCSLVTLVNQLQTQIKNQGKLIDSLNSAQTYGIPCPGSSTITDYDGNVYNTVMIGTQCWMKENLRTTHYSDGEAIPIGTTTSSTGTYRYIPYKNDNYIAVYGYMYNWGAIMHGAPSSNANPSGVQGVCPTGWHIPSDAEWTTLTDYLSSQDIFYCNNSSNIAKALASTTDWLTNDDPCVVGTIQSTNNVTGFSALPASYFSGSTLYRSSYFACFPSTTENSSSTGNHSVWCRSLYSSYATVDRNSNSKQLGYSVRCLRD